MRLGTTSSGTSWTSWAGKLLGVALAALPAVGAGCLDHSAYNALGYQCSTDADCDAATVCTKKLCAYPIDAGTRPNALNTGVPVNAVLRQAGALTLDQPNTVTENLDIQGCVKVTAANVTLRSSRVSCSAFYVVQVEDSAPGFLAQDVEVDGLNNADDSVGVSGSHLTLERVNLHGVNRAVQLGGSVTVKDSYLHDLVGTTVGGLYGNGGSHFSFVHNDIEAPHQHGYVIYEDDTYGNVTDLVIDSNWLNGGDTTVRVGGSNSSGIQITRNRFGTDERDQLIQLFGTGTTTDNVYDADGGAITP